MNLEAFSIFSKGNTGGVSLPKGNRAEDDPKSQIARQQPVQNRGQIDY
jgi:hypothetical protein